VTHNEIERRRRDKINNWISKLAKLLEECDQDLYKKEDTKANFEPQVRNLQILRFTYIYFYLVSKYIQRRNTYLYNTIMMTTNINYFS